MTAPELDIARPPVRLAAPSTELLSLMRSGRVVVSASVDDPASPASNPVIQSFAWSLGSLALFPQGILPIVFMLTGNDDTKVWFLAMYLPSALGWITAVTMAVLGVSLYAVAIADLRRPPRPTASSG